jgi:hypothetical protein
MAQDKTLQEIILEVEKQRQMKSFIHEYAQEMQTSLNLALEED